MWLNYRKADGARPRILNRGSIDPGVGNWFGGGGAKTFYDFTMIYGPQRATVWIYSVSPGLRLQRRAMIREKV